VTDIKPRRSDQTVCDEPAEKDSFCWGHLKRYYLAPDDLAARVPAGHVLFRCQRCGRLYEGEPIRHLR
jgi:hypothetical protein